MAPSNARKKFIRLIQKYLGGKASPAEEQLLDSYYESFDIAGEEPQSLDDQEKESLGREMRSAIWEKIAQTEQRQRTSPIIKRMWFRIAVAAAVVVLACIPVYYFVIRTSKPATIAQTKQQREKPAHDALPGGNKAMLTLADGTVIDLDQAGNGTIATQGSTKVSKRENGKLEYSEVNSSRANGSSGQASAIDHSPSYNTLSTPKGGQYFLELPDGSKVWLNAASSIRYPTVFDGSERLVELTGEAYFEIKKNHDKPFRVNFTSTSGAGEDREGTVEVLGTHFNVNAYNDESEIKTTLLEGAVKVMSRQSSVDKSAYVTALADKSANNMVVLKPGEQVSISHASQLSHPMPVQTEEAVAWKNGLFYFDNANIQAIMRQLARWYNVEVVYKGKIPARRFAGQVSRNSNLSQVLRILELSKVHFTIEGNVVTVLP